ncbi:MAG: single-stranded-DNA-specific exonuclease C-terminal domain-containing protein, partial [Caryophanon sp.]|nr:single-stranded-DNA-specific exonuclease C-terminal domain-containing protein [Caryophanon sp.]
NPGVVGIVASRLVEEYYKPTIVLCIDEEKGTAKGSARSIEGYHLYNELAKNRDLVPHFGGHPMAAGMTLPRENVDELRRRLHEQATQCLTEEQLQAKLFVDIPLTLDEITVEAIEDIAQLGPFGMHFAKPVYALEQVQIASMKKIGAGQNHLKLEITDGTQSIEAVSFNNGHLADELTYGVNVSFVGDVSINEWQGRKKPQFKVTDVQSGEWQLFDIRGIRQPSRWLQQVPVDDVQFVAFSDATVSYYGSLIQKPIYVVDEARDHILPNGYIVLLDLPQNVQKLQALLLEKKPARIYAHFFVQDSEYFNGMPTREQFAWFFKLLKQHPNLNWREHFPKISTQFGIPQEILKFMTKVFFELKFVRINKGLISVEPTPQKSALTDAPAYKERQARMDMEQLLVYAPYAQLKDWLAAAMQ